MSFSFALLICAFSFFTSILSGVFGMAGGMILMGLLAWVLPVQQAMILHAAIQFFANASRAVAHRDYIYRETLLVYFLGVGAVFIAFAIVSLVANKATVFTLMGISPFIAYALPKDMKLNFTKPAHAFLSGLLSTAFQLTAGVAGPMLEIFFQNKALTRHQSVATKSFIQSLSHCLKFIYFSMIVSTFGEAFTGIPPWLFVVVIPIGILGTHVGKNILEKLSDQHFYQITQKLLFAIATVYLMKAVMLWI